MTGALLPRRLQRAFYTSHRPSPLTLARKDHTRGQHHLSNPQLAIESPELREKTRPKRLVRLSRLWVPSGGLSGTKEDDGFSKLARAGFIRQSQSGIFHLLPLGQIVQQKIERVIEKHMTALHASKIALSTLSSAKLWEKSGRLDLVKSELFKLADRKGGQYLLGPTHEEEATTLVGHSLQSYKDLPIRVYQITRKYRDELRPRGGLLRAREFVMKDLYTFDLSDSAATKTYHAVQNAYSAIFKELRLPVECCRASSGDMGGKLSHEYHLASPLGEDKIVQCTSCGERANDEVASALKSGVRDTTEGSANPAVWRGVSKDRRTLVNAWLSSPTGQLSSEDVNLHVIKRMVPDLDTSVSRGAESIWKDALEKHAASGEGSKSGPRLINLVDTRLSETEIQSLRERPDFLPLELLGSMDELDSSTVTTDAEGNPLNIQSIRDGDRCPSCKREKLKVSRALELGHTFHLGTRYTEPFGVRVSVPRSVLSPGSRTDRSDETASVLVRMGCYGIGVSRIIGAMAEHFQDERGLNWPRSVAPFEAVVVRDEGSDAAHVSGSAHVVDALRNPRTGHVDAVLDDRPLSLPWKLKDADAVGYPVVVVVGRKWTATSQVCEVQCRQLPEHRRVDVEVSKLKEYVQGLLAKL